MSASNWMVCPQCQAVNEATRIGLQKMVASQYGKIDPQEWMKAHAAAQKPVELEEDFREDWDLGMTENGKFYVSYQGQCQKCSFGFKYKYEKQILEVTSMSGVEFGIEAKVSK